MIERPEFLKDYVPSGNGLGLTRIEAMTTYVEQELTKGNDVILVAIECESDYLGFQKKYGEEIALCSKTYKGRGRSILIKGFDGPPLPFHYFNEEAYRYYNIKQ